MRDDSLRASVNYGDYAGTTAGDHHDHKDIFALAKKHGVDTDKYFVIGVEFHIGETHDDNLAHTFVSILAVDKVEVQAGGIDFVKQYAEKHGNLPYYRFDIDASLEEVLVSFKRLDFVLVNSVLKDVKVFERREV